MSFEGFSKEAVQFLYDLRFCNTYEREAENAARFKELLTAPLTDLYNALLPWAEDADAGLETRRARCVSSPYRDRRFSPPSPLREYVYLRFLLETRETEVPGLFFGMGPDDWVIGLRFYHCTTRGTTRVRDEVRRDPEPFSNALRTAAGAGYLPCGSMYKADHAPGLSDGPLKLLLNSRDIELYRLFPLSGAIFGPELPGEIEEGFEALLPLFRLFAGIPQPEQKPPSPAFPFL